MRRRDLICFAHTAGRGMPFSRVDAGRLFGATCQELCRSKNATKDPSKNRTAYKAFLKYAREVLVQVDGSWDAVRWQSVAAFSVAFKEVECESKATSLIVQRPHSLALVAGLKRGELRKRPPPLGFVVFFRFCVLFCLHFLLVQQPDATD
jgi:hypothetical protein